MYFVKERSHSRYRCQKNYIRPLQFALYSPTRNVRKRYKKETAPPQKLRTVFTTHTLVYIYIIVRRNRKFTTVSRMTTGTARFIVFGRVIINFIVHANTTSRIILMYIRRVSRAIGNETVAGNVVGRGEMTNYEKSVHAPNGWEHVVDEKKHIVSLIFRTIGWSGEVRSCRVLAQSETDIPF